MKLKAHTRGKKGQQAELLVGCPDEGSQATLLHTQGVQVLLRFCFVQLLQLSFDLHLPASQSITAAREFQQP